jgi:hypothetical protein
MASSSFTPVWWLTAEIVYAVIRFGRKEYNEALKVYRKGHIGRTAVLRARDFDNAARGVWESLAGKPDNAADALQRAYWFLRRGLSPAFVRPAGWSYEGDELEVIRLARSRGIEPVFLMLTATDIEETTGPETTPNPWDDWRKI